MSTTTERDWESCYRSGETRWQRPTSPALLGWIAQGALPGGRALVPGAGRGGEPALLRDHGWLVTTVDIAASAAAFQRAAGIAAVEADLFAWEPDAPFDTAFDQTCLCALPPARWPDYAARLHRWIRPGGVLAALFVHLPDRPDEAGPPRHCPIPLMRRLFPDTLWRWPDTLPDLARNGEHFLIEQPALLVRR